MTASERGWVVGLFEGEGCISVVAPSGRGRSWRVTLQVAMTDRDVIMKLAHLAGGRVYGPYQYSGNKKPVWQWSAYGPRAKDLLRQWLPLLGARRTRRARQALAAKIATKLPGEIQAAKTHCPQGHAYTPDNTYRWNGRRRCAKCAYACVKAYRRKKARAKLSQR